MSLSTLVLSIGTPRHPGIAEAIREYESRLAHYFAYESVVLKPRQKGPRDPDQARAAEGDLLMRRLPGTLETWALTRSGRTIGSRELADRLGEMETYGKPGVAFLIGGAFGLDPSVIQRCDQQLSLSRMTLPHELARLVLTEQLYRAGTLLRGEPYHKVGRT
ncbi:MAG: 23S rRNA (pseudouridine(1915)-N(3))-methyltransferase RlmH [Gemmatimonadota bacterium]